MELFAKIVNGIKHKKPWRPTGFWIRLWRLIWNGSLMNKLLEMPLNFAYYATKPNFFLKKQHIFDHDQTGRSFFKKTIALANKQIFEKTTFCMPIFNDIIWDAFKNREKHPWSRVTFNKVAELLLAKCQPKASNFVISNTPPWVFFTFFILYKWY